MPFFGLQPLDLIVIVVVALVIFGPKRLPQLGRWLGKTFSSFRKGARDLADGFTEETRDQGAGGAVGVPGAGATRERTAGTTAEADPDQTASQAANPAAAIRCAACGASNPADARFCSKCGTRLTA